MTPKPLRELNMIELNKQRSLLKGVIIAFGIVWCIMLGLNIYLAVSKQANFALIAILATLIPILLPALSSLSKINAEIKIRNAND